MKRRLATAVVAVVGAATALTGCSSGGGASASAKSNCSNTIVQKNAPVVSVWAWYPNMKNVVDNFNNQHTDVQVCWSSVGEGVEEYNKVQTAVSAGKGLPDVVMLEADHLPTFEIQNALVDLSKYGANDVKSNFSAGAWRDVSQGDSVYAIPVDGGPMGLIYRSDIFQKYGLTPPKTWDEFAANAKKVKDAGGPMFGDLGANSPAQVMALMIQKGAVPFRYNLADKNTITIKVNDDASKQVLNYWAGLVKDGLVGTTDQFTTDYVQGLIAGKYATFPSAAWTPGYMTGAGIGKSGSGSWAVAPMPQWDPSNPVSVNWGGSTFAVTNQAGDKALAAKVAEQLYADPASLKDGWSNQVIFPLNKQALDSPDFANNKTQFFNGETSNKDIYIPAENAYKGMDYAPFQTYFYAQFQDVLTKMNHQQLTGDQAADQLQQTLVKYAQGQGFTVKE
ncbi:extracellular solute-binding protein [Arthrobacter sp. NPDC080073]|uniref:extracellular solute-binding protein n=1 Tax=Arthrobacter sp. NPDC080073 TaxID=3155919 RepID=UPI003427BC64